MLGHFKLFPMGAAMTGLAICGTIAHCRDETISSIQTHKGVGGREESEVAWRKQPVPLIRATQVKAQHAMTYTYRDLHQPSLVVPADTPFRPDTLTKM